MQYWCHMLLHDEKGLTEVVQKRLEGMRNRISVLRKQVTSLNVPNDLREEQTLINALVRTQQSYDRFEKATYNVVHGLKDESLKDVTKYLYKVRRGLGLEPDMDEE